MPERVHSTPSDEWRKIIESDLQFVSTPRRCSRYLNISVELGRVKDCLQLEGSVIFAQRKRVQLFVVDVIVRAG